MLLCTETLTLVHPTRTRDGESYACTVITGASWYGKTVIQLEDGGVKAANAVQIRLPAASFSGAVAVGDWMVRGEVSGAETTDDFAAMESCKVLSVADNRRDYSPHWAVVGA